MDTSGIKKAQVGNSESDKTPVKLRINKAMPTNVDINRPININKMPMPLVIQ